LERILSKEEISELLTAVRQGKVPTDDDADGGDFAEKGRVSKLSLVDTTHQGQVRVPNYDLLLDNLARNLGYTLANKLQRAAHVKRHNLQVQEFDDYLQGFSGQGVMGLVDLSPLKKGAIWFIDGSISFLLLEILLGGAEMKPMQLSRSLTAIEVSLIRGVLQEACADLNKAFAPITELNSTLQRVVIDPRMAAIVPPDTEMLVADFVVKIDKLQGQLQLAVPYPSLEPLKEKFRGDISSSGVKGLWRSQLQQELLGMEATVGASFAPVELTIGDILNFQVGDVIDLNSDPRSPLFVTVEGRAKFFGLVGSRGGNKAVRITSRLTEHGG
jgi:flagellar motor switch protein FliM